MTEQNQSKIDSIFFKMDNVSDSTLPKLFVVGDSISMHYGPFLKDFIADKLIYGRKGEGAEVGNLDLSSPVNGGDSSCVLDYLKDICKVGFRTDILLLNCGLHDIKTADGSRQVSAADYRKNLEAIIPLAKNCAKKVLWVRSTPVDTETHNSICKEFKRFKEDIIAYNEIADEVMKANDITEIDLHSFTSKLEGELFHDHVHFNENVRVIQAAFIAGYVLSQIN